MSNNPNNGGPTLPTPIGPVSTRAVNEALNGLSRHLSTILVGFVLAITAWHTFYVTPHLQEACRSENVRLQEEMRRLEDRAKEDGRMLQNQQKGLDNIEKVLKALEGRKP
jgi:hypothetical protein